MSLHRKLRLNMWLSDLLFWVHDAGILRCEQVQDGVQEAQIELQIHLLNQHLEVPEANKTLPSVFGSKTEKSRKMEVRMDCKGQIRIKTEVWLLPTEGWKNWSTQQKYSTVPHKKKESLTWCEKCQSALLFWWQCWYQWAVWVLWKFSKKTILKSDILQTDGT